MDSFGEYSGKRILHFRIVNNCGRESLANLWNIPADFVTRNLKLGTPFHIGDSSAAEGRMSTIRQQFDWYVPASQLFSQ
jgi:hypothetical protein